jgi:hypothetical protein
MAGQAAAQGWCQINSKLLKCVWVDLVIYLAINCTADELPVAEQSMAK